MKGSPHLIIFCGQKSPNDKGGLGFNSNNKKSMINKKKGQPQVKNSAKIICFKCKVEGHHVRSCPLKKKPLSEKQLGKRPQVQPQGEEKPLPKKLKSMIFMLRNQLRRKERVDVATYVVRRVILLLHALMVPYPTLL